MSMHRKDEELANDNDNDKPQNKQFLAIWIDAVSIL